MSVVRCPECGEICAGRTGLNGHIGGRRVHHDDHWDVQTDDR